jgi:hypothetical protein
MTIKIKLSNSLIKEYAERNNMKTVDTISHILASDSSIKTDIHDITETALKDLYVTENNKKYFCNYAYVDTYTNKLELSF